MSGEILGSGDKFYEKGIENVEAGGNKEPTKKLSSPIVGKVAENVFQTMDRLFTRSPCKPFGFSPIKRSRRPVVERVCETVMPCFSPINFSSGDSDGKQEKTDSEATWSSSPSSTPRELSSLSFENSSKDLDDSDGDDRTTVDTPPGDDRVGLTIDCDFGDNMGGLSLDVGDDFGDEGVSVEEYIGNREEIVKIIIEKQIIDGVEEEVVVQDMVTPYQECSDILQGLKGRVNPHCLLEALVDADKKGWIEARVGKSLQDMTATEKVQLVRYGHIVTDFSSLKEEDFKVLLLEEGAEGGFSRDLVSTLLKVSQGNEGVSCEVSGEGKSGSNIFYKNGEPFCIEKPVKGDIGCDSAVDAHVCPVLHGDNQDRRQAGHAMVSPGMGPFFEVLAYNLSSESLGMTIVPPTVMAYSAHEKSSVLGHRVLDELPNVLTEKSYKFTREDQEIYRVFIQSPVTDDSIDTFQDYFLSKLLLTNKRMIVGTAGIDTSTFDTKGFMRKAKDASVVETEGILQAKVAEAIAGTERDKAAISRSFSTLITDLGEGYKVYEEVTDSLLKGEAVETEKFEKLKDHMLNYLEECKISHEYREKLEEAITTLPSQLEVLTRLIAEVKSPINEKGIALFEQAIDSLRKDSTSTTAKVDFINAFLKLYFTRSSLESYEELSVEVNDSKTPKDILQKCSFQKMVAGASSWSWDEIKERESSVSLDQWQDIILLDLLVFNADRNYQNIVFKEDEEGGASVYAVDHSIILPREGFSKFDPCWRDLECSKQPWSEVNRDKIANLDTESVLRKSALNFLKMLEIPVEEGVDIGSKDLEYIVKLLPKEFQVHLETLENQIIMVKLMSELEMTPIEIAYCMYKEKDGFSGAVMRDLYQLRKKEGGEAKVNAIINSARALETSAREKLTEILNGLGKTEKEKQALVGKVFSKTYMTPELSIYVPFFNLLIAKASSATMLEKTDAEQDEVLSSLSGKLLNQAIDEVLLEDELLSLKEKVKEAFIAEAEASPFIDKGRFIKRAISDEDEALSASREELIEKVSSDPKAFKALIEVKKTELLEKIKVDYQVAVLYEGVVEGLKDELLSRDREEAAKEEKVLFSLIKEKGLKGLIEVQVKAAADEDPRAALLSNALYQGVFNEVVTSFNTRLFLEDIKEEVLKIAINKLKEENIREVQRLEQDFDSCLKKIGKEELAGNLEEVMEGNKEKEALAKELASKTVSEYKKRTKARRRVNLKIDPLK